MLKTKDINESGGSWSSQTVQARQGQGQLCKHHECSKPNVPLPKIHSTGENFKTSNMWHIFHEMLKQIHEWTRNIFCKKLNSNLKKFTSHALNCFYVFIQDFKILLWKYSASSISLFSLAICNFYVEELATNLQFDCSTEAKKENSFCFLRNQRYLTLLTRVTYFFEGSRDKKNKSPRRSSSSSSTFCKLFQAKKI